LSANVFLKVKEQFQRDGARVFVYEQPRTGDIFTITDPNLQLNQLEEVQRSISQLLNPPPAVPVTAPAAAAEENGRAGGAGMRRRRSASGPVKRVNRMICCVRTPRAPIPARLPI
jgi:hypothetical protein